MTEDKKWELTDNRFVAFLDIMGFTNMLKNKSHNDIYRFMCNNRHLESMLFEHAKLDEMYVEDKVIKQIQFSDSLILVTEDDSIGSFVKIMNYINVLIANHICNGVMIKGYLDCGRVTYDDTKNIFFGKTFVKCSKQECGVFYCGLLIDESLKCAIDGFREELKKIKQRTYPPILDIDRAIIDCEAFLKDPNSKSQLNANWFGQLKCFGHEPGKKWEESDGEQFMLEKINDLRNGVSVDNEKYKHIMTYIDNTLVMAQRSLKKEYFPND